MSDRLSTYPEQLRVMAEKEGVSLKDAFRVAGIPDSTYYRSFAGPQHNLSLPVAERIAEAIEWLMENQTKG